MTSPRVKHEERSAWLALLVITSATMMVALDTTIVNVAVHIISVDLHSGANIEWVVIAYLLGVCVAQPASGWLADRFGRSRVFLSSIAAFTLASVACAAAPTLGFLIAARTVQGLGGGAGMPVGMAIVFGIFPKERHGRALGVWGVAATLAPAIGPTLGGWLVTSVSWHWLFLINVPIGVATVVAGIWLLPRTDDRHPRPFDAFGLVLGGTGLAVAVIALSEGNTWGWQSAATITCAVVAIVSLAGFVHHELRVDQPLIELRMLGERSYRVAIIVLMLVYVCQYARLVFIPLQLESLRGETALTVGLLFLPGALCSAIALWVGGRLVDRIGPRVPIILGTAAVLTASLGFTQLALDTPLAFIAILLSLQGIAFGLVTPGVLVAGLSELPPQLTAQGSALRSLLSQVASAFAVALLGAVVTTRAGPNPTLSQGQHAYNSAFAVAAVCGLAALLMAFRIPRRPPHRTVEAFDTALAVESP